MRLDRVKYDESLDSDESNLETLVSSCHVLEKLTVIRDLCFELLGIMRVRSKSLKKVDLLEIDAPRLEHMSVSDHLSGSIDIHSIAPYASVVNIDVNFGWDDGYPSLDQDDDDDDDDDDDGDDSNSKRTMILSRMHAWRSLLLLSRTQMFDSVTVIHDYSKLEQLPQFSSLTWLHASFVDSFWELLPTFLGCCPNLHTLVLVELARFFLRNCAVLKKLTLSESIGVDIIKKIKRIRRKSRRCIIVTG
ncbi:hypothetical protein N665_1204s0017 [Sinapis alba]|nr:hypothetical protein N665_1204s0017 [Sinapis alba]